MYILKMSSVKRSSKRLSPIPENGEYKKNDDKGVPGKSKSGRRLRTPSISITPGEHGSKNTITRVGGGRKTRRRRRR